MKFESHIKVDSTDKTAVDILHSETVLSRQAIKQAMNKGAVWLTHQQYTQRIRRADKLPKPGDELHIYYDEQVLEQQPGIAVLIADETIYSIWYKPRGMLSQGSKWGDHCTINRWVEKNHKPQRPAFIVHRLDRAAAGLMIIAHQKKIAAAFADLFAQRKVIKHYQAIVHGLFTSEETINFPVNDKPATSHVKNLQTDKVNNLSLVEVSIETGRKHQIRRHLSEKGFPIAGDRLYGIENESNEEDLCLTSSYLSFRSPVDGLDKFYNLPDRLLLKLPG